MVKKILFATGGTGGHIYPAMGTASKIQMMRENVESFFAGGGLRESPFFDKGNFSCCSISSAPLPSSLNIISNCIAIKKGLWQSIKLLNSFRPHLVVGFGSYHSFPVLLAAWLLRYPLVLHEQNSRPGKVIRLFSGYAKLTGVYFPEAKKHLRGNSVLLKMPLREGFAKNLENRRAARKYFQLDADSLTLLIFGGSQGAQFLNKTLPMLLYKKKNIGKKLQALHFTGNEEDAKKIKNFYDAHHLKATVKAFEKRMDLAWQAADLAVTRAGAGTIAEQVEFEVPAIFIPYPYAADNHQDTNASYVVDAIQGGWKCLEDEAQLSSILDAALSKEELKEKKYHLFNHKMNENREELASILCRLIADQ